MKGDAKVIEYLNQALTNELTATNQYWLHFRLLDHWGLKHLAAHERKEAIEEMQHADTLTERILLLDGHPNFQRIGSVRVGETVEEVIKADLALESEAIPLLRDAIEHCEKVRDYVSRELFNAILKDEEDHVDHLETQQDMIAQMGLQNYIQLQSSPAAE